MIFINTTAFCHYIEYESGMDITDINWYVTFRKMGGNIFRCKLHLHCVFDTMFWTSKMFSPKECFVFPHELIHQLLWGEG